MSDGVGLFEGKMDIEIMRFLYLSSIKIVELQPCKCFQEEAWHLIGSNECNSQKVNVN